MVRSALKYGSAKVKFTVNVTYHQTSAAPAAQAVKAAVRKDQHHLAVVATKEAANVVVSAEVATEEVDKVVAIVVAVVTVQAAKTEVAAIVRVVQEEDS
jgi:hypothetical protein